MRHIRLKVLVCGLIFSASTQAQIIHLDDVVIQGSACIGFDCANSESFGFDTGRYKENNLRIHFDDTSGIGSFFPNNDWRIVVNDSGNGGANYFAVEDSTAGRTPFTVEAGAPNNALYVDDGGRIGIGTSIPLTDAHVVSGDSPTLRLEQDGSSGFTAQTWDLAGNETNFFIRDATNGSTLPFRIRPGAPTSAIDINAAGDVGFGVASPTASVHVLRGDGSAKILVEEASATAAPRTLFQLSNEGNTKFGMVNTEASVEWAFANPGTGFRLSQQGSGVVEMEILNNGNMTIAGALTENSDVNAKTKITAVSPESILQLVSKLPISQWEYKDARGERHIGPMAQDFYAAFGLGGTETGISTLDTAGVALVAIQALQKENVQLKTAHRTLLTAYHKQQQQLKEQRELLLEQQKTDKRLEELVTQLIQSQEGKSIYTSIR